MNDVFLGYEICGIAVAPITPTNLVTQESYATRERQQSHVPRSGIQGRSQARPQVQFQLDLGAKDLEFRFMKT